MIRLASPLSSFASCLAAVAASSIRQAKIALDFVQGKDALLALAHALHRGCRQVVVLQIVQPGGDQFAQLIRFGAARLRRKVVKALLDGRVESD